MSHSVLEGKRILSVDDEIDILNLLEEEILEACPSCRFERATSFEEAKNLLNSGTYDVVILDIMGVRGFDLLEIAVKRGFKAAMLTAHALSPEALKRSVEMKARAYLSKEKLGQIVPFLEDLLKYDFESGLYHAFPDASVNAGEAGPGDAKKEGPAAGGLHGGTHSWYKTRA